MTIAFPENDLTFYKPSRDTSCSAIQTPGRFCENCTQLSSCVNLGHSNWITVPVETCKADRGNFCDSTSKACTNAESECNQLNIPFTCNTAGVFPDPFDCQTYHFCYVNESGSLGKITSVCDGGSAFSPASGDCSATLSDELCTYKQFHCGYMDAWPGNSNIFYVCVILVNNYGREMEHPELFRCDAGLSFSDGICA